jgi:peptide-methionine (S)-S-oxide reductase
MKREAEQRSPVALATLGGGCFWCLEPIFEELEGVEDVVVGYAGGYVPNPSYRHVSSGTTGHAEVVQITYDPDVIPYRELLEVFFRVHDPTTPNRQGPDVGPQYRSIILYHDDAQRQAAEAMIRELEDGRVWDAPIVTQVVPLEAFYRAEEYHQEYFRKNPEQAYCRVMVAPKVAKFRKRFYAKLKADSGQTS